MKNSNFAVKNEWEANHENFEKNCSFCHGTFA